MDDLLCLIPARGGSKTVRRKNLRTVGGRTLVQIAVEACQPHGRVVVSTDDQDIAAVARMCGAEVWDRPAELADDTASIDNLVGWVRAGLWAGPMLVFQPTVPQAVCVLAAFVEAAKGADRALAVASPHPHLTWTRRGLVNEYRGQRQDLSDDLYDEVGVRFYPAGHDWIAGVWESPLPLVDVDTPADLAQVRAAASKRLLFRVICNRQTGSGHVRRCVQIADELQHHHISFAPHPDTDLGMLADLAGGYPLAADGQPRDLCVNDCLDTTEEQMFELRLSSPVVALEDSGTGARHASLVINELYPSDNASQCCGPDWAVLRPVFTAAPEHRFDHAGDRRLLVSFGGTDPSGFSSRLGRIAGERGWDVIVIPPPSSGQSADLASLLVWADLIVCSGGRTVWEAMACGTPALVLCQNPRELTHSHLTPAFGVLNLGLGKLVDDDMLLRHLTVLLGDPVLLADMSSRMRGVVDGRGTLRIAHRIEGLLGGL